MKSFESQRAGICARSGSVCTKNIGGGMPLRDCHFYQSEVMKIFNVSEATTALAGL